VLTSIFSRYRPVHIYDDVNGIGEMLHSMGLLDDNGLLKLQDAEL
jgi:hypothetical protein